MTLAPEQLDRPPAAPAGDSPAAAHEQLRRGVIPTQITRGVAWAMIIMFLVIVAAAPVHQAVVELGQGRRPGALDLPAARPFPSRADLKRYEDALMDDSCAARFCQPRLQEAVSRWGGFGSGNVILGRDGWLFYGPGVESVAGRGFLDPEVIHHRADGLRDPAEDHGVCPDPRPAILRFARQVEAAGAMLVLLPIPDKASLQPRELSARAAFAVPAEPPRNPSFARFVAEMREAGVDVFDPTPPLVRPGEVRYLAQDTHWTPQWMDELAQSLAAHLRGRGIAGGTVPMRLEAAPVSGVGDLVDLLHLRAEQTVFSAQSVTIQRVLDAEGRPLRPDPTSDVLLLGDSFANIYSAEPMGWGSGAGLAEHLSYHLGRPIDAIRRNDHGASATRQMLADELARGTDRLAGKKVVIWEFADRELSLGDWLPVELAVRPSSAQRFIVPPPDETWIAEGVVAATGKLPDAARTTYRDHILAVHLKDVSVADPPQSGAQSVVYLRSMAQGKRTAAADLRPGQRVRLRLRDWRDVSRQYETIQRFGLRDEDLRSQPACWGELLR